MPRLPSSSSHSLANSGRLLALALAAAALFAAGCATENPDEQVVQFETTPSGATVKIDGTPVGKTPMSAVLGRKRETAITFEKTDFSPANIRVRPVDGDLSPNPVHADLRPELLPDAPGPNPQAELAKSLDIVRQYAEMGQITPEDRVYIELRLKQFYSQPPASAHP